MGPTAAMLSRSITQAAINVHTTSMNINSNSTTEIGEDADLPLSTIAGVAITVIVIGVAGLMFWLVFCKQRKNTSPSRGFKKGKRAKERELKNIHSPLSVKYREKNSPSTNSRNSARFIIPREGKTIRHGNYEVKFPPDAVMKDVAIRLSTIPGENILKNKKQHFAIAETLRFEPSGTKFHKKFTVKLTSSYSAIKNTVPVKVFVRSCASSKWKLESKSVIDTKGEVIYTADHFCDRAPEPENSYRPEMKRLLWTQTFCKTQNVPTEKELIWYVGPHCHNTSNDDYQRVQSQFSNDVNLIPFQTFSVPLDKEINLQLNPSNHPLTIDPTTLEIDHERLESDDIIHKTCNITHTNLNEHQQTTKIGYSICQAIKPNEGDLYTQSLLPPISKITDKLILNWPGLVQRRGNPTYPVSAQQFHPFDSRPPSYASDYSSLSRTHIGQRRGAKPAQRYTSSTTSPSPSQQSTLNRPGSARPNLPGTSYSTVSMICDSGHDQRNRSLSEDVFIAQPSDSNESQASPSDGSGQNRLSVFALRNMFETTNRLSELENLDPTRTRKSQTQSGNTQELRDRNVKKDGRFSYEMRS